MYLCIKAVVGLMISYIKKYFNMWQSLAIFVIVISKALGLI